MTTLGQHKDQIAAIDCGSEFFVFPDFRTDNLIVHDRSRGFVVTHHCLETWGPDELAAAVREGLRALHAGLDVDANGVRIQPLTSL